MQPIITTPRGIRQAVKQFKQDYPLHAQRYGAEIKQARQLVKAKFIQRDDDLGFIVGTSNESQSYHVAHHQCACGKSVCEHRIAVNLAVMAERFDAIADHVTRNEAALEANEVHEELAECEAAQ